MAACVYQKPSLFLQIVLVWGVSLTKNVGRELQHKDVLPKITLHTIQYNNFIYFPKKDILSRFTWLRFNDLQLNIS